MIPSAPPSDAFSLRPLMYFLSGLDRRAALPAPQAVDWRVCRFSEDIRVLAPGRRFSFVAYQIVPDRSENFSLIIETRGQIEFPDRGNIGHYAPFDYALADDRLAFEQLVARGRIGAWGISGIGVPATILETINEDPPPAAVQAVANLLDSPGAMKRFDEPARPREIIAAAHHRGIAVMGIRAVQAGALTDALDRELPETHPEMADYRRAAPFRALAREVDPGQ